MIVEKCVKWNAFTKNNDVIFNLSTFFIEWYKDCKFLFDSLLDSLFDSLPLKFVYFLFVLFLFCITLFSCWSFQLAAYHSTGKGKRMEWNTEKLNELIGKHTVQRKRGMREKQVFLNSIIK